MKKIAPDGADAASDPFTLSPDRKSELDAQWEAASKTYCLECGQVFTDHYWAGDCANEREVNEALGAATTAFLEGMAGDRPQANQEQKSEQP